MNIANKESIGIILRQYKKENLTEEEAIKLIEDIYKTRIEYVYPITYPTYPTITWDSSKPILKNWEVTCEL